MPREGLVRKAWRSFVACRVSSSALKLPLAESLRLRLARNLLHQPIASCKGAAPEFWLTARTHSPTARLSVDRQKKDRTKKHGPGDTAAGACPAGRWRPGMLRDEDEE